MTTALNSTDKDFEQMMEMVTGFWVTQIAGAVASYSIADHLARGPASAEEISETAGIDPTAAFRLLRACGSLGLVTFDGLRFSGTPLLGTLRTDVPGSLRSYAMAYSARGHWLSWGRFLNAVQTGESQFVSAHSATLWDYYAQRPEEGAVFTHAMHGFTSGIAQEVARVLDTSTAKLAADIGGASGTLVHSLLMANSQLHGIVLDLPDVVPSAIAAASALGFAERTTVLAGDFFSHVPEADIYLLKQVLHDWNDEEAVRILQRCREAMRPDGRVIVIERLLGEIGEPGLAARADLNMMVMLAGRERTLAEYCGLLKDAGLRFSRSTAIRWQMAVIEAVAA